MPTYFSSGTAPMNTMPKIQGPVGAGGGSGSGSGGYDFNQWFQPNTQAGLGKFDPGNAGLGTYDSALLNQLTGNISGTLANPMSGAAYGALQDTLAGQQRAGMQGLQDQLSGFGQHGGVNNAALLQYQRNFNKDASNQMRDLYTQQAQQAIANAMGLEGMKGGFFESGKGRELQNMGMQASAFENSKNRELQNQDMFLPYWAKFFGTSDNPYSTSTKIATQSTAGWKDPRNIAQENHDSTIQNGTPLDMTNPFNKYRAQQQAYDKKFNDYLMQQYLQTQRPDPGQDPGQLQQGFNSWRNDRQNYYRPIWQDQNPFDYYQKWGG